MDEQLLAVLRGMLDDGDVIYRLEAGAACLMRDRSRRPRPRTSLGALDRWLDPDRYIRVTLRDDGSPRIERSRQRY